MDSRDQLELLAVTAVPPWPVVDGYGLRAANLLDQLRKDWDVTVVSPDAAADARPSPPEGIVWRTVEGVPATTALPWRAERSRLSENVGSLIDRKEYAAAVLWSGTEFLAGELPAFPPAVADRIDCETLQSWRNRKHSGKLRDQLRGLRRGIETAFYERRALRRMEGIAVTGPDDARWLRVITAHSRIRVIPNGVTTIPHDDLPGESDDPLVIFTGVLGYGPNVDAVTYFVREVWPWVRKRVPRAEFRIAGRNPAPAVKMLSEEPGVSVYPDVPDLTAAIRRAWLAVAPMRSGSGIKNKVLEAWAAGRPVVLSELATNGLDLEGEPGEAVRSLVCGDGAEMIEAVVSLLENPARRRALGRMARTLAEERHSWEAAGDRLAGLLRESLPDLFQAETGDHARPARPPSAI